MKYKKNSFDEPAKIIKRDDAPVKEMYALTFKEAFVNFFTLRFSKENFKRMLKDSFPQKSDSKSEKIRKIIMDVSFVLLVLGLSYMVFYYHGYRERITQLKNWENAIELMDVDKLPDYQIKKLWEDIKSEYPDVAFPEGMSLKFASLYAVNSDTVGVLSIPEKDLWTPLLQNKSQPEYYLWKDIYGEYNRYGNPYVDYRSNVGADGFGKHTIIYGHNTHDRLGFNILTTYMKLDGYKKAPVITFETLYQKSQWKIFAVMLTNSTAAADRGHLFKYLITDFSSDKDFMNMIDGVLQRSMIKTDVDVNENDKILTLYTCYQDIFKGGRLVIMARLLRDGESAEVDVSKASFNHNARYPQAYYDQLKLTNPYESLTKPLDENGNVIENETDTPFGDDFEENTTNKQNSSETTTKKNNSSKPTNSKPSNSSTPKPSGGTSSQKPSGENNKTEEKTTVKTEEKTTQKAEEKTTEKTNSSNKEEKTTASSENSNKKEENSTKKAD